MTNDRGFTFFELLVVMALMGVLAAVSVPVFIESSSRNRVWTAAELIGAQVRQARLKAISRNTTFRVRFDCPVAGQFRVLTVTGDAGVDDAVDRCDTYLEDDSGVFPMPEGVDFGAVPTLEVNGRGLFTSLGGAIPQQITVAYGNHRRILNVSAAGQIAFRSEEGAGTVTEEEAGDTPVP